MGVYILGAGGHAKVVIATLQASDHHVIGILDDARDKQGASVLGVPVLGQISLLKELGRVPVVAALGENRTRSDMFARYAERVDWVTAVHPKAHIAPDVQIGEGTVVFSGAILQPGVVIGRHAIVNTGATIDHDCVLGDFVHVAPGVHLSGSVIVDDGVLMGVGSCAIPGVRIGEWTTIGAGGAVISDLPGHVTAVGVPARPIQS